jgi:hypothetical protein
VVIAVAVVLEDFEDSGDGLKASAKWENRQVTPHEAVANQPGDKRVSRIGWCHPDLKGGKHTDFTIFARTLCAYNTKPERYPDTSSPDGLRCLREPRTAPRRKGNCNPVSKWIRKSSAAIFQYVNDIGDCHRSGEALRATAQTNDPEARKWRQPGTTLWLAQGQLPPAEIDP